MGRNAGLKLVVESEPPIPPELIAGAGQLFQLEFTRAECEQMAATIASHRVDFTALRGFALNSNTQPAFTFRPDPFNEATSPSAQASARNSHTPAPVTLPPDSSELALLPITQLARLLKARHLTSTALTELYLTRLERFDPALQCVITFTADHALQAAARADAEIADGNYRGALHGIPWGAKDLLATRGICTTWGARPLRNHVPDSDATVVRRLAEAGAVLVAKLSTGALGSGNRWFGGETRNPWDVHQGSGGSSAGPAAATAAGLVGFALGTETHGSLVSPGRVCGVTTLRPTFGRISRHGVMPLSWSMDKVGPMARSVEDCALVFRAVYGPDGHDAALVDRPFPWDRRPPLAQLRIGHVQSAFEEARDNNTANAATLDVLRGLGVDLIPVELPQFPVQAMRIILKAEAAASFDEMTRCDLDDELTDQSDKAWPNVLRASRFIPAVEYIQANRIRTHLLQAMADLFTNVDVYAVPATDVYNLGLTNLTGHPAVTIPNGFSATGLPTAISFIGPLYGEHMALAVAKAVEDATGFHRQHPPMANRP